MFIGWVPRLVSGDSWPLADQQTLLDTNRNNICFERIESVVSTLNREALFVIHHKLSKAPQDPFFRRFGNPKDKPRLLQADT